MKLNNYFMKLSILLIQLQSILYILLVLSLINSFNELFYVLFNYFLMEIAH